jgi:hypothetical protein
MGNIRTSINSDFSKQYFYKKEIEFDVPEFIVTDKFDSDGEQLIDQIFKDVTTYYAITKNPPRKKVPPSEIPKPEDPRWLQNPITASADVEFIEKYVPFKDFETFTTDEGRFVLNTDPRDLVPSSFSFLTPKIKISAPGYISKKVVPLKGDGSTLDDLGRITLIDKKTGLDLSKIAAQQSSNAEINASKDKDNKKDPQTEILIKSYSNLKQKLIPTLLDLLAEFGMAKAQELISKGQAEILEYFDDEKNFCPSPEALTSLLKKKNNLVSVLNNTFTLIDTSTKIIGITGGVIELLSTAYQTLKLIPLPSSTGVPGVPGLPVSLINNIEDFKLKFDKTIVDLRRLNNDIASLLTLVRDIIVQCIQYLNLLDQAFAICFPDTPLAASNLAGTLNILTQTSNIQNTPVIEVNGFTMDIETENTTNPLKRKRALAKNKQGVSLLQGEWSFSSIDQILIDELVFYIQQNNLKAD